MSHSSSLWISMCGRISTATVYEYNNLFLLVSKWRKPLRNHIKRTAKKTCRPEFVVCQSQKRLAGCMSCASKKRNKCWSFPPLMTNKHIHTHAAELQKPSHFQPLSHDVGQKERDILWLRMMARQHWKGEEHNLPVFVSVLAELAFVWRTCLVASVSGECPVFHHLYLSPSQYTVQYGFLMGWGLRQSELCALNNL